MWQHLMNPPNWFTFGSIFCSLCAILQMIEYADSKAITISCMLIIAASLLDGLDGWLARVLERSSVMGAQLDSFADFLSFGVAPAIVLWTKIFRHWGFGGLLITGAYVIATALRLARFNAQDVGSRWTFHPRTRGLTSTVSGSTLVALVWVSQRPETDAWVSSTPAMIAGATILCTLLQGSNLPFRGYQHLAPPISPLSGFVGGLMLLLALSYPAYVCSLCGTGYVIIGGIEAGIHRWRHTSQGSR